MSPLVTPLCTESPMPMIEYHGWITLESADPTWDDGKWGDACDDIQRQIANFKVDDGHCVAFAETTEGMDALQLSGFTNDPVEKLLGLMARVGSIVPGSYGELTVLNTGCDLSGARRYRLANGAVSSC